MKFARPILIGSIAFVVAAAILAIAFLTNTLLFASPTIASANPTRAVIVSATHSRQSVGKPAAVATPTPNPTGTSASTPAPTKAKTPTPAVIIAAVAPPTPPPASSAAFRQGMMLRTDGDYANASISFRAVLADKPDPALARQAQFRLGEALWLAGDDANAVKELTALITANNTDNYALRAHYFLAQVMQDQRNWAGALEHLRAYRAKTTTLQGELDGEIADILLSQGNGQAALNQYLTGLKDQTLTPAQRVQLLEKLAEAYRKLGQPAQAVARLGEAFPLTPDAKTAAEVEYKWGVALDAAGQHAAAAAHWRHVISAYPEQDDAYSALVALVDSNEAVDDFQRGLIDWNADANEAAIQAFNRYVKANPDASGAAYYYLGRAYFDDDQDSPAIAAFDTVLSKFPKDENAADAAYYRAKAIVDMGDTNAGVDAYNAFADRFPNDARAAEAMYQAARNLDVDGQSAAAQAQYQKLVTRYPANKNSSTALFNIGLDYFFDKNTDKAEEIWKQVAKKYPNTTDADHANFWLGKLAKQRGDNKTAEQFLSAAATSPRSYYSYRALDLLQPFDAKPSFDAAGYSMNAQPNEVAEFEKWLAGWTGGTAVSYALTPAVLADFNFKRGAELAQLDQAAEARLDFAKVNAHFLHDARSLYSLAVYYQQNNYFDLSIRAAQQLQALSGANDEQTPRYLRELIYPTYYADLVVPYAERNGFDPALFFALMRQESTYNPLAKSWVGASGLTQVMPATGQGIARQLGVSGFKTSDLLKPTVAIRFGTYFFGQLYKMFDGNPFYSLGGYNAGPGNAKKWVRADVDEAVEIIHLSESYLYVRTIYSQYNQYLEIYRGR